MTTPEAQVLTVAELTERIRTTLEGAFAEIWVSGEISNFRRQDSGHCYFTLKDGNAQLTAVMFRRETQRIRVALRDGMQVVVLGRISVYPARGNYQLICQFITDTGLGQLQQRFEELKRKLGEEGLFDPTRKKPLPSMPRTVGFVTSPTGAAIRDFISIMRRRGWCGKIIVFPARVQGQEAAPEIVSMIQAAEQFGSIDLLVVGRGGGSLEDLWPFNEESVVRAIAACSIPTVSAVGHEIDFTLSDFVADKRAETPSAAAELISSHYVDSCQRLSRLGQDLDRCTIEQIHRFEARLELLGSKLSASSPRNKVDQALMRVDDLQNRLSLALRDGFRERRSQLERLENRLKTSSPETRLEFLHHRIEQLQHRLTAASPQSVLNRGFAIVRNTNGQILSRKKGIRQGDRIVIAFADGEIDSQVVPRQQELPF